MDGPSDHVRVGVFILSNRLILEGRVVFLFKVPAGGWGNVWGCRVYDL